MRTNGIVFWGILIIFVVILAFLLNKIWARPKVKIETMPNFARANSFLEINSSSPDSRWLVLSGNKIIFYDTEKMKSFVFDYANNDGYNHFPTQDTTEVLWSKDGRYFLAPRDKYDNKNFDSFLIEIDNKETPQIYRGEAMAKIEKEFNTEWATAYNTGNIINSTNYRPQLSQVIKTLQNNWPDLFSQEKVEKIGDSGLKDSNGEFSLNYDNSLAVTTKDNFLYIYNLKDKSIRKISAAPQLNRVASNASLSPDNKYVLYSLLRTSPWHKLWYANYEWYLADISKENITYKYLGRNLMSTSSVLGDTVNYVWAKDGKSIYALSGMNWFGQIDPSKLVKINIE